MGHLIFLGEGRKSLGFCFYGLEKLFFFSGFIYLFLLWIRKVVFQALFAFFLFVANFTVLYYYI